MNTIGKYKIIKELGSGGFGAVYLCEDQLGQQVAIKIFQPKDDVVAGMATSTTEDAGDVLKQRFKDEAKILHELSENPYIVNFMHYDETEKGTPYYVMPYLSHSLVEEIGKDVFSLGAREDLDPELYPRRLTLPRTIEVLEQTAKALSTVHKAGLVHRDIKPANLLINKKGDVQLCDFGIAKLPDADHSQSGVGMGSRNYMSPEQRESAKHVKSSSDIYSLGVIAYRLVTGTLPIGHFDEPIELRPSVGKEFNRYILQCLKFEAEQRPQDAQSFLQGLIKSSKSIDSQAPEPTDDTSTQMGGSDFSTIKDELKPVRDQVLKLLEAHGDIPEEEMPALHITASMGDLDDQGLEALIEEVFITNQKTLKPKRKLRELIKKRASTEQLLNDGEYQAYLNQVINMGWNEAKLKELLKKAGLSVLEQKNETTTSPRKNTAKSRKQQKAKDQTTAKPKGGAFISKIIGAFFVLTLLVGGVWLSQSTNTPKPNVKKSEVNLNESNVKSQAPLVVKPAPKKQALNNTAVVQKASQQKTPIKKKPIKKTPIKTTPKQKTPSTFPVTIATLPRNAKVNILTIQAKYYAGIKIPAKAHRIKVSKTGYISKTLNYDVTAPLNITITLEKVPFDEFEQALGLVSIPAGSFKMGSNNGKSHEKPVHRVTISAFNMMANELTWAQYQPCIDAGVCNSDGDAGFGKGKKPVINVNWNDAQTYATWLSNKTGKHYRLPSESEWEYAARAGSITKYAWGNSINCNKARYDGGEGSACYYKSSNGSYRGTKNVGAYSPNAFGLYDMHGNVWEWVQDCYQDSYAGAPRVNKAWESGDCAKRVLRGSSWDYSPYYLRSAHRYRYTSTLRDFNIGFRLVQGR